MIDGVVVVPRDSRRVSRKLSWGRGPERPACHGETPAQEKRQGNDNPNQIEPNVPSLKSIDDLKDCQEQKSEIGVMPEVAAERALKRRLGLQG